MRDDLHKKTIAFLTLQNQIIDNYRNESEKFNLATRTTVQSVYRESKRILDNRKAEKAKCIDEIMNKWENAKGNKEKLSLLRKELSQNERSRIEYSAKGFKGNASLLEEIKSEVLQPLILLTEKYGDLIEMGSDNGISKQHTVAENNLTTTSQDKLAWDPEISIQQVQTVCTCLTGDKRFNSANSDNLQARIVKGEIFEYKLVWYGRVNSLVTIFYDLKRTGFIVSGKKKIAAYISSNFMYYEDGATKEITHTYSYQLLKDGSKKRVQDTSKNYVNILKEAGLRSTKLHPAKII